MSSFPCTGNSILELNYVSFAGYYSQVIKTTKSFKLYQNWTWKIKHFFGIIFWSKIFNLVPENAGNGMS